MIWGCMTAEGPGYMCKIDGTMDQNLYKTILQDDLMKTMEFYRLDAQGVIFQHLGSEFFDIFIPYQCSSCISS